MNAKSATPSASGMRKIGLLGGLSWVSTAAYYRRLNELVQARLGGAASARLVLESLNRQDYVDAVIERRDEAAARQMIMRACGNLQRAGADFIVISCNDVHRFAPAIEAALGLPLLHIAEVTAREIVRRGLGRVGLLGVMKTMEGDFYPDILRRHAIDVLQPPPADRQYVHARIYDELVHNRFTEATRAGFRAVVGRLAAAGAGGVILGCTEIPLLLRAEDVDIPTFDTTELHCQAAVERALVAGRTD